MFQTIFRAQSEDLFVWPIVGLGIFIVVFVVKVISVMRSSDDDLRLNSELPLIADEERTGDAS